MYKKLIIIPLTAMLMLQCSKDLSTEIDTPQSADLNAQEQQILSAAEDFGFEIFSILQENAPDSNIFISPLSISMALGMTMNGAETETETAMRETLCFDDLTQDEINQCYRNIIDMLTSLDPQTVMEIANSIWYRQEAFVLQDFIDVNKTYFDAEIVPADFGDQQTVTDINNWCAEKTHDKIDRIIDRISRDAFMFLINAIYFKGTWQYQFDADATIADYDFQLLNDATTPVDMMLQTNEHFSYTENDAVQFIDLPYGNGQFAMSIILPKDHKNFNEWALQFTEDKWKALLGAVEERTGTLYLPKFKVEYSKKLNDALIQMGMGIAFTGQADFSGINGSHDLYISFVKHKTFVQVDEEGTEAAAVTIVGMERNSAGPSTDFTMIANQPFLYILHEKSSGSVLFMGKMLNPNEGE